MIEKINEYLIKNDSHSPCPSLIKRATEWRKKDIFELYADIFASISRPDELFALLALKPKPQPPAAPESGTPSAALSPSSAPSMANIRLLVGV